MKNYPEPIDLRQVKVYPLAQRSSLSSIETLLADPETPPQACDAEALTAIRDCASKIAAARRRKASVILMYGAHLIKNGALRIVNSFMERAGLLIWPPMVPARFTTGNLRFLGEPKRA